MTEHPRPDVISRFRGELLSGHRRPVRRRLPRTLAATAAAAASIGVAVAFGFGGSAADDALAITTSADSIVVRIADADAGPQQLTDELKAAGINATVLVVPVAEDKVGTWVQISSSRVADPGTDLSVHDEFDEQLEAERERKRLAPVIVSKTEVRIPTDYSEQYREPLVLIIGATPKPGQAPLEYPRN